MNITRQDTGNLTATIKVEIVNEDYQENVKKVLKDYQRKTVMPGFRPGKVPFAMINRKYGNEVMAEEINKKLSDSLNNYFSENKIKFIGEPLPNIEKNQTIDWKNQKDFNFYFDIGLYPEFEINPLENTEIEYYDIIVDDKVIDNYINGIQKKFGTITKHEISKEGNILKGEIIELDEQGNVKEDGIRNNTSIFIDNIKLKSAKKKFIGIKLNDKVIFNPLKEIQNQNEISLILGIKKEDVKNFKSNFQFTVNEIENIEPAPIDENLLKKVYTQYNLKNEAQLRERIKTDASFKFVIESENKFKEDIFNKIIEQANISLPDDFIKRWILETNKDNLTKENIDIAYTQYSKSLSTQLVKNKIIEDYKIEVKEDEVKDYIKAYFADKIKLDEKKDDKINDKLNDIASQVMKDEKETKKIYDELYDKKLMDLFKTKLIVKNKKVTYEEFIKLTGEK